MEAKCKPRVTPSQAENLLKNLFGLTATCVRELCGYDDYNFYVKVVEKEDAFILKVTNSTDSAVPHLIEELNRLHIFCREGGISVPMPYVHSDGHSVIRKVLDEDQMLGHAIRLMVYLPGKLLKDVAITNQLLFDVGVQLSSLHSVTEKFDSDVLRYRDYIWSLKSVPLLQSYLSAVQDSENRELASQVITDFVTTVVPVIGSLKSLYVHGDPNEQNILVTESERSHRVCGLIDFGDSHFAPRIFDLAAACLYMMLHATSKDMDVSSAAKSVIDGYSSTHQLSSVEKQILPICVKARLTQSLVLGAFSSQQQPDNEYVLTTAVHGWQLLRLTSQSTFEQWRD